MSSYDVFGLCAQKCNQRLLLRASANCPTCKLIDIFRGQATVAQLVSPISIYKSSQDHSCQCSTLVGEVPVLGCLEVLEYLVECTLVFFSRVCSVPAEGSDSVCEIQASAKHGIHDGAEGALI